MQNLKILFDRDHMEINEHFIHKKARKNYQNFSTRDLYDEFVLCNLTIFLFHIFNLFLCLIVFTNRFILVFYFLNFP